MQAQPKTRDWKNAASSRNVLGTRNVRHTSEGQRLARPVADRLRLGAKRSCLGALNGKSIWSLLLLLLVLSPCAWEWMGDVHIDARGLHGPANPDPFLRRLFCLLCCSLPFAGMPACSATAYGSSFAGSGQEIAVGGLPCIAPVAACLFRLQDSCRVSAEKEGVVANRAILQSIQTTTYGSILLYLALQADRSAVVVCRHGLKPLFLPSFLALPRVSSPCDLAPATVPLFRTAPALLTLLERGMRPPPAET